MNTDTKTIIREHFNDLPPVVQDVILNSKWESKIRRIVENNKLHIDQGAAIENLVFVTMLGMEVPDDFIQNAQEYANVSEEKAYAISLEVEREIFGLIRKKLVEITDTANTVDDIGRVTDELSKVADDIQVRATSDQSAIQNDTLVVSRNKETVPTLDISGKPKRERKSLKDTIPINYFEKGTSSHSLQNNKAEMDESFAEQDTEEIEVKETVEEKPVAIPIRKDSYREPIETEDAQPKKDLLKPPIKPILLDDGEDEETEKESVHIIESEIPTPEIPTDVTATNPSPQDQIDSVISGNELVQQDITEAETANKKGLFGLFKKKKVSPENNEAEQVEKNTTEAKEDAPTSIVAEGLAKPLVTQKEQILFGKMEVKKDAPKPDFVEKPQTAYDSPTDPYRESPE